MTEQQMQAELDDGLDLRAKLVAAMKRGYSLGGDGLLVNMADAVLAAGWRPAEQAGAERAERIATAIEGEMTQPNFGSWRDDGVAETAFECAARIARTTP